MAKPNPDPQTIRLAHHLREKAMNEIVFDGAATPTAMIEFDHGRRHAVIELNGMGLTDVARLAPMLMVTKNHTRLGIVYEVASEPGTVEVVVLDIRRSSVRGGMHSTATRIGQTSQFNSVDYRSPGEGPLVTMLTQLGNKRHPAPPRGMTVERTALVMVSDRAVKSADVV